jgi:tetratricopeptide (TPR) repeat protein
MILVTAAIAGVWYFRSHRTTTRLTDNDIIVVSDFDNKTGDAVFDDTLKQGLSVQLEQSPFLALLSEPRVNDTLKLMGRHAGDRLTPEVTREVCQRTGSKAMLTGSIAALGSQYVIGLKAVNCDTGDVLAQAQEQAAGKEAVLKALDSGVVRLRSKLGESLSSVQKYDTPLEQATTSSLEALQAYSLGVKQQNQSNFSGAIPFLKRATELDPNFAMAYAHLGTSCLYSGQTELAKESYTKAYYLRERVTDRERFHIEGVYYINVTGELKKAAQVDELWKSIYPQDATPNILLCVIYEKLGQYDKELGEAREAFRKRPTAITSWNLVTACIEHGQLEEAKKALADAEVRQLRHEEFPTLSYEIAFLRNDPTEMERIVKAAPSGTGLENDLWSLHSLTAAYYGRVKNAREFLRRTVELARRRDSDSAASYLVSAAVWEATFGNASEARGFAAEGLSLDTRIDVMSRASLAYARAGDLRQAQALADELARKHPTDTILYLRTLPMIRAEIEIKQNNPSRAIEILQNVNPLEMGDLQVVYTRGQAYLLLHRGREATAEFQKILDHPGIVVNDPLGALAYLGMARAHVLRSDYATARIGYEHFFTLWKDADPDIPIYKEAKAEYAKLQ